MTKKHKALLGPLAFLFRQRDRNVKSQAAHRLISMAERTTGRQGCSCWVKKSFLTHMKQINTGGERVYWEKFNKSNSNRELNKALHLSRMHLSGYKPSNQWLVTLGSRAVVASTPTALHTWHLFPKFPWSLGKAHGFLLLVVPMAVLSFLAPHPASVHG